MSCLFHDKMKSCVTGVKRKLLDYVRFYATIHNITSYLLAELKIPYLAFLLSYSCSLPRIADKWHAHLADGCCFILQDDMHIRVYNYNTLERVHQFEAHSDYLRSIAVHPTQTFILTSSGTYCASILSIKHKQLLINYRLYQ